MGVGIPFTCPPSNAPSRQEAGDIAVAQVLEERGEAKMRRTGGGIVDSEGKTDVT